MTYAKNFVAGYGLNWARWGEPVEGFSNPLWTFYMVIIHLLPIPENITSLFIQITALFILAANLFVIKLIASQFLSFKSNSLWLLPVFLTAFYFPLNYWSLFGFEVCIAALLTSLAIYFTLSTIYTEKNNSIQLGVVLTLATLTRMDLALIAGLCFLTICTFAGSTKIFSRYSLYGLLIFVGVNFMYLVFRIWYFNDIFPNPYYVKMTGIPSATRLTLGWYVFNNFFFQQVKWLFLITVILSIPLWRDKRFWFLFSFVGSTFVYSIYVGGDAWERSGVGANRWAAQIMPVFFLLLCLVVNKLFDISKIIHTKLKLAIYTILILSVSLKVNGINLNNFNERIYQISAKELTVTEQHKEVLANVLKLRADNRIARDAKVAVVMAGIPAYFSMWKMIDILGLNDKYIAKLDWNVPVERFHELRPGHDKRNLNYSVGKLKPDIIFQWWRIKPKRKSYIINQYGYYKDQKTGLYFRKESENIDNQPL